MDLLPMPLAESSTDLPPQPVLFRIPIEVRDMIYENCVVFDKPIYIKSPSNALQSSVQHLQQLLCISKQLNTEISKVFYAKNTWVFGNGDWGSTQMTNEHALKIFLRRVPKANIAQIKHVIVQIHGWMNPNRSLKYDTFNGTDASSLNAVSRALAKHFKSLQFLRFEVPCWMPSRDGHLRVMLYPPTHIWPRRFFPPASFLTDAKSTAHVVKSLAIIFKNPSVKEVRMAKMQAVYLELVIEAFEEKRPDLKDIFIVEEA